MKKMIIISSVAIIGFVLAATTNSWAQRDRVGQRHQDRGGHSQKWDRPEVQEFNRSQHRGDRHYRPEHRFRPGPRKPYHYRAPQRSWHKYRHWRHQPHYRYGHPQPYYRRHPRAAVVDPYRSHAAPEEAFHAAASVSEGGFSVSIGISQMN